MAHRQGHPILTTAKGWDMDDEKQAVARFVQAWMQERVVMQAKLEQEWREWLEAMAREDDARAMARRGQVEASWAAMRERWKDEADR